MKKNHFIAACGTLAFVTVLVMAVGVIVSNAPTFLTQFFTNSVSFEDEPTLSFSNVEAINVIVKDVPISITEDNVDEITITSTVENNGIGFTTKPKVWVSDNALYYNQGVILGIEPKSTGELTLIVPKSLELDYNIINASGNVLLDVSTAKDANFDMAVGELNIYTSCENFTATTVSGDINIYGAMKNISVDTVSSDVSMFADATTDEINFKSVSGDCMVFADELAGYNLNHKYSGGNIDSYFELSSKYNSTVNITADTVDGKVELFDRSTLSDISVFYGG